MADETEVKNPEQMSFEELKAAAAAQEAEEEAAPAVADMELPAEEAEEVPEQFVYKKEIDLGDGSGVQVFSGKGATALEALEELTEKLAEAQRHATRKIHELNSRVKAEDTRSTQQIADDEYVFKQRLEKEPRKALREEMAAMRAEEEAAKSRELAVQQAFVDAHPDYDATPNSKKALENGTRMIQWMQLNGCTEMTEENLEKAYQSLARGGLLHLKTEEAGGTTEDDTADTSRIVKPTVEATQPRSPKKASTVSTRGAGAPTPKAGLSEDELYSMPLEKLRQISNEQLARAEHE
jgi:hypothetical protein